MTKQRLKLAAVLFVLALNGCVSPSIHDGQKAKILPRDSVGWSLQGKAAVTQADKSGSTVNLAWHHSETTRDHIRLSGPLGTGALELLREGEHLFWLDDGIKQPVDLLPMNDEARSVVVTLPLGVVSAWLIGYPDSPAGWAVEITQWQIVEGWQVPRTIAAHRNDVSVRLVVLTWDFGTPQL